MQNWYIGMTGGQKKLVYIVSILLVPIWGIGLFSLIVLIYLQLGQKRSGF